MSHHSDLKSKSKSERFINVCVVGLSGYDDGRKSLFAVGKSCLCSRFVRRNQDYDEYNIDHSSIFSTSDFVGSVINNDHFLYWGRVNKIWEDGTSNSFRVIEQTELIDDSSYSPLSKGGKLDTYTKRCAMTKLNSPGKIMYISRDQVALQSDYEQSVMDRDGKFVVDGFICVYDVSTSMLNSPERRALQEEILSTIITNIIKTKKPVIVVATKCDEGDEALLRQAHQFVHTKKLPTPLVESSAATFVNVDLPFQTIAQMTESKGRFRTKFILYTEGELHHNELTSKVRDKFLNLVKNATKDCSLLMNWVDFRTMNSGHEDFIAYLTYFGTRKAQSFYNQQAKKVKQHHEDKKLNEYLSKLPEALDELLPSLQSIEANEWKWEMCQQAIKNHIYFDKWFFILPDGSAWNSPELLFNTADSRIPMDVLQVERSRACFDRHIKKLRESAKKQRMKTEFRKLLEVSHEIRPGTSWTLASQWISNEESYKYLEEDERKIIFETYLRDITLKAKLDFQELLFESASKFIKLNKESVPSKDDILEIESYLQEDIRYKNLEGVGNTGTILLFNHIALMQSPNRCLSGPEKCMDRLMQQLVEMTGRRNCNNPYENDVFSENDDEQINILVIGKADLAKELEEKIRLESSSYDSLEYIVDGQIYSLNLKVIDYHDTDESAVLDMTKLVADFKPQGYLGIFSDGESLSFLKDILKKAQECDAARMTLPLSILMASDPAQDSNVPELRRMGQELANKMNCLFVDFPFSLHYEMTDDRIHESQVQDALRKIVDVIQKRTKPPSTPPAYESSAPDLKILLCAMCGDEYAVELILGPLLHHHSCYSHPEQSDTVLVEAYLGTQKRTVSITLGSYHRAYSQRSQLFHGFILVYSATRKASLETLRAFATTLQPAVPIQLLAVTGSSSGASVVFHNDTSEFLQADGTDLSKLSAKFQSTSPLTQKQAGAFATFFGGAYDKRKDTELILQGIKRRRQDPLPEVPTLIPEADVMTNGDADSDIYSSVIEPPDSPYVHVSMRSKVLSGKFDEDSAPSSPDHRNKRAADERSRSSTVDSREEDGNDSPNDFSGLYAKLNKKTKLSYLRTLKDRELAISSDDINNMEHFDDDDDDLVWQENLAYESHDSITESKSIHTNIQDVISDRPYATVPYLPKGHKSMVRDCDKFNTMPEGGSKVWANEPEYASIDQLRAQMTDLTTHNRGYEPDSQSSVSSRSKDSNGSQLDLINELSKGSSSINKSPRCSPNASRKDAVSAKPAWLSQDGHSNRDDHVRHVAPLARPEEDEGEGEEIKELRKKLKESFRITPSKADKATDNSKVPNEENRRGSTGIVLNNSTPRKQRSESSQSANSLQIFKKIIRKVSPAASPVNSDFEDDKSAQDTTLSVEKPKHKRKSFRKERHHHSHIADSDQSPMPDDGKSSSKKHHELKPFASLDASFRKSKLHKSHKSKSQISDLPQVIVNDDQPNPPKYTTQTLDRKKKRTKKPNNHKVRDDLDLAVGDTDVISTLIHPKKKQKNISISLLKKKDKRMSDLQDDWNKIKAKDQKFKNSKYFGKPLEEICEPGVFCPIFVKMVIKHVEANGLQSEGIYRLSGNKNDIEAVMQKFEDNNNINLQEIGVSVHAITGALKNFFKLLPGPLVPYEFGTKINEVMIIMDAKERLEQVQSLVNQFPKHNLEVFKHFMIHLHSITEHRAENKMDVRNLQTLLYPTLMRPAFDSLVNISQNLNLGLFIQTCIEHCDMIFDNKSTDNIDISTIDSELDSKIEAEYEEISLPVDMLTMNIDNDLMDSVMGVKSPRATYVEIEDGKPSSDNVFHSTPNDRCNSDLNDDSSSLGSSTLNESTTCKRHLHDKDMENGKSSDSAIEMDALSEIKSTVLKRLSNEPNIHIEEVKTSVDHVKDPEKRKSIETTFGLDKLHPIEITISLDEPRGLDVPVSNARRVSPRIDRKKRQSVETAID